MSSMCQVRSGSSRSCLREECYPDNLHTLEPRIKKQLKKNKLTKDRHVVHFMCFLSPFCDQLSQDITIKNHPTPYQPHLASVRSHRHLPGGFIRFIHSIWDSFNEPAETRESSNASNKTERHTTRKQFLLKIRTHPITAKYTVAVSRVWMKY